MTRLITIFSVFLVFFGLHTGIALAPGGTLLAPYVLCFIGAVTILCLNVSRIRFRLVLLYGFFAAGVMILAVITSRQDGNLGQHIISSGQLLYAIVIAYGTFLGLQVMGRRSASRFFLLAAIILITGSFLELYGGLKPVSDGFRAIVNSWHAGAVYSSDLRDIQDYGGIRPKFFTSEPSILGTMTGFSILFWFVSGRRFSSFRLIGALFLIAPAFLLIRSPTLLLSSIIIFIFYLSEFGRRRISHMRTVVLGVTALAVILIAPGIVASNTSYGRSSSFFEREIAPPLVAAGVLRSQPLFGTGIGGWSQEVTFARGVFAQTSGSLYHQFQKGTLTDADSGKNMLASALWEFWIVLGLVGGIFVIAMLWRMHGELGVPHRFVVFIGCAIILTMGGAVIGPRHWIGLFTLGCLDQLRTAERYQEDEVVSMQQPVQAGAGLRQWAN